MDYSKWEKIELSDDEDFECHPNVDKKSFIRFKQAEIHRQREARKERIHIYEHDKKEYEIAKEKLSHLFSTLTTASDPVHELQEASHAFSSQSSTPSASPGTHGDIHSEIPLPSPSSGLQADQLALLVCQAVVDEPDLATIDPSLARTRIESKMKSELKKLDSKLEEVSKKLQDEIIEQNKKLTSDNMFKPGFDKTIISKQEHKQREETVPQTKSTQEVNIEVLNPEGVKAAMQKTDSKEGDEFIPDAAGLEFSKMSYLQDSYNHISKYPHIVTQDMADNIMAKAFQYELEGQHKKAVNCVHQGSILQFCSQLGRDGIYLFFKRMIEKQPKAVSMFEQHCKETYERIAKRCSEINQEKKEKIQKKEELMESIPEEIRLALEQQDIETFNALLGQLPDEEASRIIGLCEECGLVELEELTEEEAAKLQEENHQHLEMYDSGTTADSNSVDFIPNT